jgi:riboflavin kinase / FMN adenylyltransferase
MAAAGHLGLVIITFEPHPRIHLGHEISLITTPAQKRRLLEETRPDVLFIVPFSDVIGLTAEAFIADILVRKLRLRALALGHDFRFGRNRSGDETTLARLSAQYDFALEIEPPVTVDGRVASSSAIRHLLTDGEVTVAARLLGRPYRLEGTVVRGDGRGAQLGFPTLNLQTGNRILPEGVFRSRCEIRGTSYDSLTHIGPLPTFSSAQKRIETHVLNFSASIYGEEISVDLLEKIRPILRFPTPEALVEQIRHDIETTFPEKSNHEWMPQRKSGRSQKTLKSTT